MSLNPDPDRWMLGTRREWALYAVGVALGVLGSYLCPGSWA
jgi:hypothetical protein